jgi:hypothetical protein
MLPETVRRRRLIRSIRPKRAAPCRRESSLTGRQPVEPTKMPARQARAERWGNPWGSSAPHLIVTLTRPCEDPSVTPKTPPGASRGLRSSHSISIGDGAVSPPRSGFVLRCCIRKANGASLVAALADGLADTRFFSKGEVDERHEGVSRIPGVREGRETLIASRVCETESAPACEPTKRQDLECLANRPESGRSSIGDAICQVTDPGNRAKTIGSPLIETRAALC